MSGEQRLEGQGAEELEGRRGLLSFSPTDSVPPSTSALDKAVSVTSAWKPNLFPLVHAPSPNPCFRLGGGDRSHSLQEFSTKLMNSKHLLFHPNLLGLGPLHVLVKFKNHCPKRSGIRGVGWREE